MQYGGMLFVCTCQTSWLLFSCVCICRSKNCVRSENYQHTPVWLVTRCHVWVGCSQFHCFHIKRVEIHPKYSSLTQENDVMLVQIELSDDSYRADPVPMNQVR